MAPTIVGIALAAAGTGALYSHAKKKAESEKRRAEEQAQEIARKQDEQLRKIEEQQKIAEGKATTTEEKSKTEQAVRSQAKERQRKRAISARGRRSTILTTPLGLPGQGARTDQKTLLGS